MRETASGLSKNPLGIIALFIVLVYGMVALVTGFGGAHVKDLGTHPLVWFLTGFPVLVLVLFGWLVTRHHGKLYGPRDYREDETFLSTLLRHKPDLLQLPFAGPEYAAATRVTAIHAVGESTDDTRTAIYQRQRGIFLTHLLAPPQKQGPWYDAYIYLLADAGADLGGVQHAEFFFGPPGTDGGFAGTKTNHSIGVKTAAYAPFLCTCRVTFTDGETTTLHRYIDFEMGHLVHPG